MRVYTLELIFVGASGPCCLRHKFCTCNYVLVDLQTLPMISADELFDAAVLQQTNSALQAVGGLGRLVVCYEIFFEQRNGGLVAMREASTVHYEFLHR